jgi:DNA-binding PucR family transcriptional regulator
VRHLLDGRLQEAHELAYELNANHLALLGCGAGAGEALRELAAPLDRRLLLVEPGEQIAWAWLGSRLAFGQDDASALASALVASAPLGTTFALGEPGAGTEGWRLSHRQAVAALSVAGRGSDPVARYRDVALLAAVLGDEIAAASLRRLYLEPLESGRDGGAALRETLRAYFDAGGNISSTACALGVVRNTVSARLRTAELRLGRRLTDCAADLEVALRLDCLDGRRAGRLDFGLNSELARLHGNPRRITV